MTQMSYVNSGAPYIYIQQSSFLEQFTITVLTVLLGNRRIGPLSSTPLLWKITLATRFLYPQNSRHTKQVLHSSPSPHPSPPISHPNPIKPVFSFLSYAPSSPFSIPHIPPIAPYLLLLYISPHIYFLTYILPHSRSPLNLSSLSPYLFISSPSTHRLPLSIASSLSHTLLSFFFTLTCSSFVSLIYLFYSTLISSSLFTYPCSPCKNIL